MTKHRFIASACAALGVIAFSFAAQAQQGQGRGGQQQAAPQPTGKAAVVRTASGQVQGVTYGDIAVYRGIPFAAPPVGALRWRAPQLAASWSGVKDASTAGSTCTQAEDCLYVNVHKPAEAGANARLPVMVWIYGGAFTSGSGSQYDGNPFAKKGVVVVTLNYRLGRAGWFGHPALTKNAPAGEPIANYGMQDQVAALKWVQRNIAAFGGDPRNVTIFGESAGAQSVNYLMTIPQARGLFHKAIAESSFARLEPKKLADEEALGAAYFASRGVNGDTAATLTAMRAVPFNQLNQGLLLGSSGVINDGKMVSRPVAEVFAAGQQARVPYIVGGNSNEASLIPTPDPAAALARLTFDRPAMIAAFDPAGRGEASRIVAGVVTDLQITEPDRNIARLHAKVAPTYVYYFSYLPPAQRATSLGVAHGAEIGYVWGRSLGNPEDAATTQAVNSYWAAFAKYGAPGAAGGPAWPKYDAATDTRLEFGVDGPKVRENFQKARLDWIAKNREAVFTAIPSANGPAANAAAAAGAPAGRGGAAPAPGRGGRGG